MNLLCTRSIRLLQSLSCYFSILFPGPQGAAVSHFPTVLSRRSPKKEEADEIFTRRLLAFTSSITASSASAEAVVEGAVAAGAFPSDAGAGEVAAASSNGGDGDDDGGARSRHHPCVHRQAQHRRMRLRRRLR